MNQRPKLTPIISRTDPSLDPRDPCDGTFPKRLYRQPEAQTKPARKGVRHTPEGYSDIIDPQVLVDIITERDSLKAECDTLLEAAKMVRDEKIRWMAGDKELTISASSYNWLMAAIQKAEAAQ